MNPGGLSCAEAEALAPELALGTIDGAERAAVLSHLAGCAKCRDLVDQLAGVADGLLLLAPRTEPPPGFETRVLSRMTTSPAAERTARPSRRPRRALVGVAAVALIAALAGVGLALLGDPERTGGDVYTALAKDDEGRWTCLAVAYDTDPARLVVALDRRDGANRTYIVEANRVGDATWINLGNLTLKNGDGSMTAQLQVPASELHSIRMRDDETRRVRYEMEFRPSS